MAICLHAVNEKCRLDDYLSKDIRHLKLKIILLRAIWKKPSYSYGLIDDFSRDEASTFVIGSTGKELKNDVYNTLKALEKSKYIKAKAKIEHGKLKNYYHITPEGRRALKESKRLLMRFLKELSGILV
jgi:DNA-binding PadR family transcriptional regulator